MEEKDLHQEENPEEVLEENVEVIDADETEAELSESEKEVAELQDKNKSLEDRLLRLQAEFENYKRRTTTEKSNLLKYKSEDLALSLLETLDNFERALQTEITDDTKGFYDGMTMVYNQLKEALKSQGVEVMEVEGEVFDPNLHHGVMQVEDDNYEPNVVVEALQKGYMIKDKVLRPAMVKVNK